MITEHITHSRLVIKLSLNYNFPNIATAANGSLNADFVINSFSVQKYQGDEGKSLCCIFY